MRKVSEIDRIIDYFMTAPLEAAEAALSSGTRIVKNRKTLVAGPAAPAPVKTRKARKTAESVTESAFDAAIAVGL